MKQVYADRIAAGEAIKKLAPSNRAGSSRHKQYRFQNSRTVGGYLVPLDGTNPGALHGAARFAHVNPRRGVIEVPNP